MTASSDCTILVVDDNEGTRYTVVRTLRKAGFTVWEASRGDDALRQAANGPDLVILDVNLPDMNGFEVARRLRSTPATASIPLLQISASMVESECRSLGLEAGADGYLTYPVEPRELLANIQALLRIRKAEQRAREQSELLHVTLSSIGDAVIATDAQGRITFLNPAAEELTGYERAAATGKPLSEVFVVQDDSAQEPAKDPVGRGLESPAVVGQSRRVLLVSRDGSVRPIEDGVAPIRDANGKAVGGVLVFRDVTHRREAEKEIARLLDVARRQSEQLRKIAASSLTINAAGNLDSVLPVITSEARKLIGARQAMTCVTVTGNWDQTVHVHSLASDYVGWEHYRPDSDRVSLFSRICRVTGPVRLTQPELEAHDAWRAFAPQAHRHPPLRGLLAVSFGGRGGKPLGILLLSDPERPTFSAEDESILVHLGQVAAVAIENARLYDALRHTDRLEDEFLAMLAHELRNPLAPILNSIQVLRIKGAANPEARWATDVANRQVQQLTRLVDDLLDVSRINQGKINLQRERIDLTAIVSRAVETSRPLIESRRHRFELAMPPESLQVHGDPVRLAQVLWNLLVNAAKYTPEGGLIRLSVEKEEATAVVRVRDSGVGIALEMLPKVFDLFAQVERTLDRAEGGLGIGLTLVRRLTEMHGGSVEAQSEGPGLGSEFVVRLPLFLEQVPGPSPADRDASPSRLAVPARRVLVVDDNRDSANTLAMLLRLLGHEVKTAHDGVEALGLAEESPPEVVVLDIGLPEMNGFEVAREMRARPNLANTVLVALTGYGTEEDRRRSQQSGFALHLVKPVDLAALQELLVSLPAPGSKKAT